MDEYIFNYKTSALDFLLYTYFGITLDCSGEDMICAAIMKAYDDATMQGAYNALFRKDIPDVDSLKNKSDEATKEAACLLKQELDLLLKCKEDYNEWHEKLCDNIEKCFEDVNNDFEAANKKKAFTYGNAQKWVNMTIKYICIFDALCEKDVFHKAINRYCKQFQIPVDSYIIEALWSDQDIYFPNAKRDRKYTDGNVKGWSCWEDSEYKDFIKSIDSNSKLKSERSVLVWENRKWIEQSEIRKGKKGKSFDKKKEQFF